MRVPVRKQLDAYVQQVAIESVVATQTNQSPRRQGENIFPCYRDKLIFQNFEDALQEALRFRKTHSQGGDLPGTNCV